MSTFFLLWLLSFSVPAHRLYLNIRSRPLPVRTDCYISNSLTPSVDQMTDFNLIPVSRQCKPYSFCWGGASMASCIPLSLSESSTRINQHMNELTQTFFICGICLVSSRSIVELLYINIRIPWHLSAHYGPTGCTSNTFPHWPDCWPGIQPFFSLERDRLL